MANKEDRWLDCSMPADKARKWNKYNSILLYTRRDVKNPIIPIAALSRIGEIEQMPEIHTGK